MSNVSASIARGDFVQVIENGLGASAVRSFPIKQSGNEKGWAPEGSVLVVSPRTTIDNYSNPFSDDQGLMWWYVRARSEEQSGGVKVLQGWAAAIEEGINFLAPIASRDGCTVPSMTKPKQPTYLHSGARAFVATVGENLNVRPRPQIRQDEKLMGKLPPGSIVRVSGQPQCDDAGRTWWQIDRGRWVCENEIKHDRRYWYLVPMRG